MTADVRVRGRKRGLNQQQPADPSRLWPQNVHPPHPKNPAAVHAWGLSRPFPRGPTANTNPVSRRPSLLPSLLPAALQQMITFLNKTAQHAPLEPFTWDREYLYQQELCGLEGRALAPTAAAAARHDVDVEGSHYGPQWALLRFEQPLTAPAVSFGLAGQGLAGALCLSWTSLLCLSATSAHRSGAVVYLTHYGSHVCGMHAACVLWTGEQDSRSGANGHIVAQRTSRSQ